MRSFANTINSCILNNSIEILHKMDLNSFQFYWLINPKVFDISEVKSSPVEDKTKAGSCSPFEDAAAGLLGVDILQFFRFICENYTFIKQKKKKCVTLRHLCASMYVVR